MHSVGVFRDNAIRASMSAGRWSRHFGSGGALLIVHSVNALMEHWEIREAESVKHELLYVTRK